MIPKRPADARDAREVARKLIKSGAIQAIQRPTTKQDQTSFKRPKGQERKRIMSDSNVAPYQPYSSTQSDGFQGIGSENVSDLEQPSRVQNLYEQFETERDREERGTKQTVIDASTAEKPRSGNTIFVSGQGVTEDFFRKHFSKFGKIVNVSMEIEKGCGFITFVKPEWADRAITEMRGKSAEGIQLVVQLARRQPQIAPINDASSSAAWSSVCK